MPYYRSSVRRSEGIKLLHIQGDNLVQTTAEVVAKRSVSIVWTLGNFAQPGLREEERVDVARAEAIWAQGIKDGPGPFLHGVKS
jgi:hypothetical protein